MASWEQIEATLRSLNDDEFLVAARRIGDWQPELTVSEKTRNDYYNRMYPKCMSDRAIKDIVAYRLGLPTDEQQAALDSQAALTVGRESASASKRSAMAAVVSAAIALLAATFAGGSLIVQCQEYRAAHSTIESPVQPEQP